jgi:hypothetical protein
MFLAFDSGMKWKGLAMTGIGGGAMTYVMDNLMGGFH